MANPWQAATSPTIIIPWVHTSRGGATAKTTAENVKRWGIEYSVERKKVLIDDGFHASCAICVNGTRDQSIGWYVCHSRTGHTVLLFHERPLNCGAVTYISNWVYYSSTKPRGIISSNPSFSIQYTRSIFYSIPPLQASPDWTFKTCFTNGNPINFSSQQKLTSRGCARAKARSYETRVCCVLKAVEAGYRGGRFRGRKEQRIVVDASFKKQNWIAWNKKL